MQEIKKIDPSILSGVSRNLKTAFALDFSIDPDLVILSGGFDGSYSPDTAADHRVEQLIKRLKHLPWGEN